MSAAPPSVRAGLAAAVAAALIGAGWQVASRFGATTTLAPTDLALFRYAVPAILLAPLWLRLGPVPAGVPLRTVLLMAAGGGFPFGLLVLTGAAFAPVAHMGALLPGTMPLFVAGLAAATAGERFDRVRLAGFAALVAGVGLVTLPAAPAGADSAWVGHLLFLAASLLWAVFTLAAHRSGLSAWAVTATVSLWSAPLAAVAWAIVAGDRLAAAPVADLLFQAVWQGGIAGVGGVAAFALAVRHLGPVRAALSGAAVPLLSAAGGALALGEIPGPWTIACAAAASAGIVLASGAVRPVRDTGVR